MKFITDKQTLDDLNLLGKFRPHSIYGIYNKVRTGGGERLLESMFTGPMNDPEQINLRSRTFRYFQDKMLVFPFQGASFRIVEDYLAMGTANDPLSASFAILRKKIQSSLLRSEQFGIIHDGLVATVAALHMLKGLLIRFTQDGEGLFRRQAGQLSALFADRRLQWLTWEKGVPRLSTTKVMRYDYLLRHTLRNEMEEMLDIIYQLDVYIAVSDVARQRNFFYATMLPAGRDLFRTTALRHPALEKAIANPLELDRERNLLFLTGANMAGKSTFMKSFGIAVYLAHMGFPVAAAELELSVRDGLYTSINVPDDLSQGYSHFYAEVRRVKLVAEEVGRRTNLVVIFDELFKGTNVKDAFDATLAVTEAFAGYRNCCFIISTHIIEVGETLGERCDNIRFSYLPTIMEGAIPRYPYRMQTGITTDRHGMMIIENERILDIIRS